MQFYSIVCWQPNIALLDTPTHDNRFFIRVRISILRQVFSHLGNTSPTALKKRSCLIFEEQDEKVKLKAFIQQTNKWKLTALVLVVFVLFALLCWKPKVASTIFSLSRSTSIFNWRRSSTWEQWDRARCTQTTLKTRERLQCYWNVGVRKVETVENNQYF